MNPFKCKERISDQNGKDPGDQRSVDREEDTILN